MGGAPPQQHLTDFPFFFTPVSGDCENVASLASGASATCSSVYPSSNDDYKCENVIDGALHTLDGEWVSHEEGKNVTL